MTVTSRDRGYNALVKRAIGMHPVTIAAGILAKDGESAKKGTDALTLIQVAVWNEFGTSDERVPERSFIRAWFDEQEPDLRAKLTILMRQVVAGKLTREQALDQMGLYCVGAIQKRMAEGVGPANAPSTVKAKGSSTPLVDTGQLRSSISFEVREGK